MADEKILPRYRLPEPESVPINSDVARQFNLGSLSVDSQVDTGSLSGAGTRADKTPAGWKLNADGTSSLQDFDTGQRTLTVLSGEDIQKAIDIVNTEGGGTVFIKNGTHVMSDNIILPNNVTLEGQNVGSAVIDFDSKANQIQIIGSAAYSTGTVSISNGGVTVTGSGTSWATNAAAGQNILLGGLWYPIAVVSSNTSIIIGVPYGSSDLAAGTTYVLATTVSDVQIKNVTIKNSTTSAVHFQYTRDLLIDNIDFITNATALEIDDSSQVTLNIIECTANNNGISLSNVHFVSVFSSGTLDDLVGNGLTLNGCTNMSINGSFFVNSAGDGMNITDCSELQISGVTMQECAGQGAELVSGNDNIKFTACAFESNDSDGIKLTATSDNINLVSCSLRNNGGYGANIAAATCDNNIISSNVFTGNTTDAVNDLGTGTVIRGNVGVTDNAVSNKVSFGGDGSDGALSITSGTTTIDLSNSELFVKNYSSISITGTGKLAFSNPATAGSIIYLKSTGNVTITSSTNPAIDASALGSAGGAGSGTGTGAVGTNGNSSIILTNGGLGGGGGTGGGSGGISSVGILIPLDLFGKAIPTACGGGGGGGGSEGVGTGGAGGVGGGCIVIECVGALNITSTVSVAGENGFAGANTTRGGTGGGGGGAGGVFAVVYKTLTTNSATFTVTGGSGGDGGDGGADGPNAGGSGAGGGANRFAGGAGGDAGAGGVNGSNGSSGGGTGGGAGGTGGTASTGGGGGGGGGGSAGNSYVVPLNNQIA